MVTMDLSVRFALLPRMLRRVQRPWTRYVAAKELERQCVFAQQLLVHLQQGQQGEFTGRTLTMAAAHVTRSDVVVAMLHDNSSAAALAVLKLPLTPDAHDSLARHRQVITLLHSLPALHAFGAFVPRSLAWNEYADRSYYIETAMPGRVARDLLAQPHLVQALLETAAHTILQLHLHTQQRHVIDEAIFARLAAHKLDLLARFAHTWPDTALLQQKLAQLRKLLRSQLVGQLLPLSWIHGDFWLGNILAEPDSGTVSGIIDWDRAAADEFPLHDLLHLLAYTRKLSRQTELGEEVIGYLLATAFNQSERMLVDQALTQLALPNDAEFIQIAIWLYWLRLVTANLLRYPKFRTDGRWLSKNIFLVLKQGLA